MNGEKQTITKDDIGMVDMTPTESKKMDLSKFKKLAVFTSSLRDNSLIICPKCKSKMGLQKWIRVAKEKGLVCPVCRVELEKGITIRVDYFGRLNAQTEQGESGQVSTNLSGRSRVAALGKVSVKDTLIKAKKK